MCYTFSIFGVLYIVTGRSNMRVAFSSLHEDRGRNRRLFDDGHWMKIQQPYILFPMFCIKIIVGRMIYDPRKKYVAA